MSERPPTRVPEQEDHIADSARASGFLAGGNFFELGSRALIALLLARWLGVDGYGLYVLAVSAASIFTGLSLLGLDRAMIRYVAIMARRRDRAGLLGTIKLGLVVSTAGGIVLGAVLFLAAAPVAENLFDEPELAPLLELMAVVVPFLTISSVLVGVAQGFKRMDYTALAENVIQTLVRLSLLGVLAALDVLDVFEALVVFGVADVAATITLVVLLRRDWLSKHDDPDRIRARYDTREVMAFAFPLWLSGILRKFRNNIETFLLGTMSVVSAVGIYSVVNKINLVGHVSYLAILGGVRPTLAGLHDSGDRFALANVYATATRWTLAVNLPFFLVITLFPEQLLGVFGDDFRSGATALILLALAELVNAATGVCQSMIDMTGHTTVKLINSFLWMVLAVVASFLLIPEYGLLGAAIATLIAISVVNVLSIVQVWYLEKLNPFDRRSIKPFAAALVALAAGLAARALLGSADEYMVLVIAGPLLVAVYFGALMALGLEEDDRRILRSVTMRVRKKLRWRERESRPDLEPEASR